MTTSDGERIQLTGTKAMCQSQEAINQLRNAYTQQAWGAAQAKLQAKGWSFAKSGNKLTMKRGNNERAQ